MEGGKVNDDEDEYVACFGLVRGSSCSMTESVSEEEEDDDEVGMRRKC